MINLMDFGIGLLSSGFMCFTYHMFRCFSAIDRDGQYEINHRYFMMKFNTFIVFVGLSLFFIGAVNQ